MLYGKINIHTVRDMTDLIGIRTLVLRQYWDVTIANATQVDIDAAKPAAPAVPGGLLLMGDQTLKEHGRYSTLWTYQGINGDGKSATFKDRKNSLDYGFEPGFSQVPIQMHPNFEELYKKYQGMPTNDGTSVKWAPTLAGDTSGGGGGFSKTGGAAGAENPMYGIQAFFEMEGVYRFRYAAKSLPRDLQKGVGYIAHDLPGQPPSLGDGRNWLKAPVPFDRKGNVFDITEYYWLSRRGGWPQPVYGKGSGGKAEGTGFAAVDGAHGLGQSPVGGAIP